MVYVGVDNPPPPFSSGGTLGEVSLAALKLAKLVTVPLPLGGEPGILGSCGYGVKCINDARNRSAS